MGTYVYALNTRVRTISNMTVGVAEFRYKPHTSAWGAERLNQALYNRTCARRVEHFKENKLPFFFVMGKLEDGSPLYSHLTKDGRVVGACFGDGGTKFNRVGTVVKAGRSYKIDWI